MNYYCYKHLVEGKRMFEYTPLSFILNKQVEKIKKKNFETRKTSSENIGKWKSWDLLKCKIKTIKE